MCEEDGEGREQERGDTGEKSAADQTGSHSVARKRAKCTKGGGGNSMQANEDEDFNENENGRGAGRP